MKKGKKGFSIKDRFGYWFDNRMAKGSLTLIKVLIILSLIVAAIIAGLIILFGFNEEGETASVFWNSIATVINAWMPYFEEGSVGYLILMSVTAIAGVLFTSVLIGIITSAIEERIGNLKRGNSQVLENGHTVLLGFYPGEYTLLRQLILAAADSPTCIVVAEDMDREEMEQDIGENVDLPKNVRIVCRTADITDPASLEKCSLETAESVIVSPTEDLRTLKAVLAASALLEEKGASGVNINAILSGDEYLFPASLAKDNNISTLHTKSIIAKMIAHSCTQTGLSETFREVFDFEGCEFYLAALPGTEGITFGELTVRLDRAVPAGVCREGETLVNPSADFILKGTDRVLVFTQEEDPTKLEMLSAVLPAKEQVPEISAEEEAAETVIVGQSETLPLILDELPENVSRVCLVGGDIPEEKKKEYGQIALQRGLSLTYWEEDPRSEAALCQLARKAGHIVLLNDHGKDPEEADMETMLLLLNLRDIRKRFSLSFNITVELQKEDNHKLVGRGDHTDFLVSSSMSSMILAQLAESPELIDLFREILSNQGNELYLKKAGQLQVEGPHRVVDLRRMLIRRGYVMLGLLDAEKHSRYNLPLEETVTLSQEDDLILLGRD